MSTSDNNFISRLLSGSPALVDVEDMADRLAIAHFDMLQAIEGLDYGDQRRYVLAGMKAKYLARIQGLSSLERIYRVSGLVALSYISHPEVFLPFGFDEVRYCAPPVIDSTIGPDLKGTLDEAEQEIGTDGSHSLGLLRRTQYRTPDGVWHDIEGVFDRVIPKGPTRTPDDWLAFLSSRWTSALKSNVAMGGVVSLPALTVPSRYADSALHLATKSLLIELHRTRTPLRELPWRRLEEIVAELLHHMGLEVSSTSRSRDGGRDVVARGELIPGEPTLLAVEVKHMNVVTVGEIREALWANRHFPALLFATSGRFSAGVFRERRAPDTGLRLYLKDGVVLGQWIGEYATCVMQGSV